MASYLHLLAIACLAGGAASTLFWPWTLLVTVELAATAVILYIYACLFYLGIAALLLLKVWAVFLLTGLAVHFTASMRAQPVDLTGRGGASFGGNTAERALFVGLSIVPGIGWVLATLASKKLSSKRS